MAKKLYPVKSDNPEIYKRQITDKSCTICVNVGRGGMICKECLENDMKNWRNYYEQEKS